MQVFEVLAKLTDRLRTIAAQGVTLAETHVTVQLPDNSTHHIREITPSLDGIVLHVD